MRATIKQRQFCTGEIPSRLEGKLLRDTTSNYSGQRLMRDTGNACLAFSNDDPGIAEARMPQPAPALGPIPRSSACLGLRGATFYLARRPHLPPFTIPLIYLSPSVISVVIILRSNRRSPPLYLSMYILRSLSCSSLWHREKVLIKIRKQCEQSDILRLNKRRNKRQLVL